MSSIESARASCWHPGDPALAKRARTRAAQVREHLAANARRVRPLLKHIIALDLQSVGPHPVIDALGELASSYRDDCTYLFYEPSSPAGHAWNELLRACDREQAFRAFEAATLWGVRRGLRNGSLWLPHAEQYGGQHRLLLPALRWTAARGAFLERHHLPATADPFIERVLAQIGSGCEGLNAALATGDLMISPRGHVILRDDPAVTSERSDAELLRNQLYARVGRAQLTELLLAIDGETHFSWELPGSTTGSPRGAGAGVCGAVCRGYGTGYDRCDHHDPRCPSGRYSTGIEVVRGGSRVTPCQRRGRCVHALPTR